MKQHAALALPILGTAFAFGCGGGGGGGSSSPAVAGATEVRPAPHVALRAEQPAPVRSGPRETYGVIGTLPAGHVYVASHKNAPGGRSPTTAATATCPRPTPPPSSSATPSRSLPPSWKSGTPPK